MKGKRAEPLELPAATESFPQMQAYFQELLDAEAISKELVMETMLVVEALFHNILEQEKGNNTTLRLTFRESLGNVVIGIGFEGKMAYLFTEEDGDVSPKTGSCGPMRRRSRAATASGTIRSRSP